MILSGLSGFSGTSGTSCWSSNMSISTFASFICISAFPSEDTISVIFISVFPAFKSFFAFKSIFTMSSGVILPAFIIAINSPVSLLYFSSSQLF